MQLPPFPVDEATLSLLSAAIDPRAAGDTTAQRSCVGEFLTFMSQMGGADTEAVEDVQHDAAGRPQTVTMRDPRYHEHDVITALIAEVRRLRAAASVG